MTWFLSTKVEEYLETRMSAWLGFPFRSLIFLDFGAHSHIKKSLYLRMGYCFWCCLLDLNLKVFCFIDDGNLPSTAICEKEFLYKLDLS